MKEFYIDSDGIRLHCKLDMPAGAEDGDCGEGRKYPLVIIIHGFTGHMEERHIKAVSGLMNEMGFASLRAEMYGHGKSGGSFREHNLFKWLDNAMAVTDYAKSLDFVSELYICGHSQGGFTAIMLAGMKPDDFRAALPLSPAVMVTDGARAGFTHGLEFDPMHVPEEVEVSGRKLSGNYIRAAQVLDIHSAIGRYKGPVLIVHGSEDEAIPAEMAAEASEEFSDAELVIIPGDDHCYNYHLDQVLDAVRDFMERVRP